MIKNTTLPLVDALNNQTMNLLNSLQMCDFCTGVVTKVNPLEILIDQKWVLDELFLTLTNAVKDHTIDITVSWQTVDDDYLKPTHTHGNGNNGSPTASTSDFNTTHHHDIKGRKQITIHNGLTIGEQVLLLRKQGGGDYIVLDRLTPAKVEGESL